MKLSNFIHQLRRPPLNKNYSNLQLNSMKKTLFKSVCKAFKFVSLVCRSQGNFSTLVRNPVLQKPKPFGKKSVQENIKFEGSARFEHFDDFKLRALLSSACQANNLETARNVFNAMKKPISNDFFSYVSLLGKVTSSRNKVPASVHSELARISSLVVADSRYYSYRKLMTALMKALSYSKSEQRKLIQLIVSKPASETYDCGVLASFLKFCLSINDKEFPIAVWEWGKSIRERDFGTHFYFSTYFQYHNLFGSSVSELKAIWNQITECDLNEKVELVNSMCSALSIDINEQKQFISMIISRPPASSFDCGLLCVFMKHCCDTIDKELGMRVWEWGKSIRERDFGTPYYFSTYFQYQNLFGSSVSELKAVWNQITECGLTEKAELVRTMCTLLSIDLNEQKQFILMITSKPSRSSFDCGHLCVFMKHCCDTIDKELGMRVWEWGKDIRERGLGTHFYFSTFFQYHNLFGSSVSELKAVWNQITECGLTEKAELVRTMCTLLSIDLNEQKQFILMITSKPSRSSFDCGLLCVFMKHCCDTNDKELGMKVWEWGKSIREQDFGSPYYFSAIFQNYHLVGASLIELKAVWNQITEIGLNEKVDLVNSMCSALSIDLNEQKEFISLIISKQPKPAYDCGLLGIFLVPCSIRNDVSMAQRVWAWGLTIREKEKGSLTLCYTTIQYLGICSESGDLDLLESVWMEAERFNVTYSLEVKKAYLSALASHSAIERAIKTVDKVGSDSLDCHILTILVKSISEAGEHERALELLRRCQKENPASVSIISYSSLIDGFCQIGNFDAALSLIDEAKFHGHEATEVTWTSILSSCRKHQNLQLAEKAFEQMKRFKIDENRLSNAYFMMSEVYKACGDEVKEKEILQERLKMGLQRSQREVKLDVDGSKIISFFSNQISHTLGSEDSDNIDHQMKEWIPLLEARGIPTESILNRNGEMLALAYAVSVLKMKEVVLRKDFRLSIASHEANRVLSGIHGIKIRHWDNVGNKDLARLHVMIEGKCLCRVQYTE